MKRYTQKQEAIRELFEYEEKNNIAENGRLTHDPYKDIPEIPDASPRKKPYVDIRRIESKVRHLKHSGEIDDDVANSNIDDRDFESYNFSEEDTNDDNSSWAVYLGALAAGIIIDVAVHIGTPFVKQWWKNRKDKKAIKNEEQKERVRKIIEEKLNTADNKIELYEEDDFK